MAVIITKREKRDAKFYKDFGPFLASRDVAKEIGYHLWDDSKTDWFSIESDSKFAGFVSCRVTSCRVNVTACYVLDQFRKQGLLATSLEYVMHNYEGKVLVASANANSLRVFKAVGFKPGKKLGSYVLMRYENA